VRVVPLSEAVAVNPKIDRTLLADDTPVSFVPMAAVGAADGSIDASAVRPYAEVKKGYTHFRENDVLFAKVTPCMENGKMAVARNLKNGMGFGSTEFHVLRPREGVDPHYVYHFVSSQTFRKEAARHMTGAVGLRRVPSAFLESAEIPLPALEVQREIVAEIEKQFSRLDEAVANLQRVKANLKRYKDSVYSEAFGNAPNSTLGELIEVGPQNGLYLPKDMYGDGVPILRIYDYQTAWIRPVQELRRVKATQEQISTWALCEDDLVVNRVNSMTHLGKCVRVPKSLAGTVFESNMMRIRLTATASPKYVEHYLASRLGKKRLTGNAKWAVNQASINQKDVRATPIFIPDLARQVALVAEIDRRVSIAREVEAEVDFNLQRAQALRQATLLRAFEAP